MAGIRDYIIWKWNNFFHSRGEPRFSTDTTLVISIYGFIPSEVRLSSSVVAEDIYLFQADTTD